MGNMYILTRYESDSMELVFKTRKEAMKKFTELTIKHGKYRNNDEYKVKCRNFKEGICKNNKHSSRFFKDNHNSCLVFGSFGYYRQFPIKRGIEIIHIEYCARMALEYASGIKENHNVEKRRIERVGELITKALNSSRYMPSDYDPPTYYKSEGKYTQIKYERIVKDTPNTKEESNIKPRVTYRVYDMYENKKHKLIDIYSTKGAEKFFLNKKQVIIKQESLDVKGYFKENDNKCLFLGIDEVSTSKHLSPNKDRIIRRSARIALEYALGIKLNGNAFQEMGRRNWMAGIVLHALDPTRFCKNYS